MTACSRCASQTPASARFCSGCGSPLDTADHGGASPHHTISALFAHIPHPHIRIRRQSGPKTAVEHQPEPRHLMARINNFLAVRITDAVGTMWCAYAFAALALVSLPDAIRGGTGAFVSWTAQTFIQLVLLSIIIVGQKVASEASDKRAIDTFNDAEAVLHEAVQIQKHLAAQDAILQRLIDELCSAGVAGAADGPGAAERAGPDPGDRPA